jgi:hypothetical protein
MPQAHNFNVGDNIDLIDHHCSVGRYIIPCFVDSIDGDVYVLRKREFLITYIRVGKYYPHMRKS